MIGVAREDDARRIMDVLPKRMSKYGLTVHPEKTRLVRFHPERRPTPKRRQRAPPRRRHSTSWASPTTGAKSRGGGWVVKRKTARSRLKRALQALSEWCRKQPASNRSRSNTRRSSRSCKATTRTTGSRATYFSLQEFLEAARKIWQRWLSRRRRDGSDVVDRFSALGAALRASAARVVHSLLGSAANP